MSKTKIVETYTGQSVSDFGTKLWNCAKLEFRKSGIGQFCAKWLLRMIGANCCFFAQNWCAKKEKFCVSFRKNCAKVLQMETLGERNIECPPSKKNWYTTLGIIPVPLALYTSIIPVPLALYTSIIPVPAFLMFSSWKPQPNKKRKLQKDWMNE